MTTIEVRVTIPAVITMAMARRRSSTKKASVPSRQWQTLAASGVSLEEARNILEKVPYSLGEIIIEERKQRRAVHTRRKRTR